MFACFKKDAGPQIMAIRSVLSLVERGWCAARDVSLRLAGRGIGVEHLIKGKVGPVKTFIAPHSLIRLIDSPRQLFPWVMGCRLLWGRLTHRIGWVLCDNERTLARIEPWCRRLGVKVLWVREREAGYDIIADGKTSTLEEAFKA